MFPFPRSLINKGEQANFKKKHFLIHLETFTQSLCLWEFQRTGKKFPNLRSLINKGKHQNFKKKHFLIRLETFTQSLCLWELQRTGKKFPSPRSLINKRKHQNFKKKHFLRETSKFQKETFFDSFGNIFWKPLFIGIPEIGRNVSVC